MCLSHRKTDKKWHRRHRLISIDFDYIALQRVWRHWKHDFYFRRSFFPANVNEITNLNANFLLSFYNLISVCFVVWFRPLFYTWNFAILKRWCDRPMTTTLFAFFRIRTIGRRLLCAVCDSLFDFKFIDADRAYAETGAKEKQKWSLTCFDSFNNKIFFFCFAVHHGFQVCIL